MKYFFGNFILANREVRPGIGGKIHIRQKATAEQCRHGVGTPVLRSDYDLICSNCFAKVLAGMAIENVIAEIFYLRAHQVFTDEKIKRNDGIVVE